MIQVLNRGEMGGLPVINFHAAGIDVGSTVLAISYTDGRGNQCLCTTGCFTKDLRELVSLFEKEGVKDVAMEATGVYWMSLYEVLEEAGIKVTVIHPGHYKNSDYVKTDGNDSIWIHQYKSCGILRNSHIAPEHYRELRNYIHERNVVQTQKSETLTRIQRILTLMNLKIQHLISDIEGVGGMKILRAIASGTHDAETLVDLININQFKASREDLVASLEGIYKTQFVNMLRMKLVEYDFFVSQMKNYEVFIEEVLKKIALAVGKPVMKPVVEQVAESGKESEKKKGKKREKRGRKPAEVGSKYCRKNQYHFDVRSYLHQILGVDLTVLEGFDEKMLLDIVCVTGVDMSKWSTAQHFTSWLNLSPRRKQTGGKYIGNETRKTNNPATQSFRISANSLSNSKGHLGVSYRRLSSKQGPKTATKAIARKMAVLFYTLVKNQQEYDPTITAKKMKEQEEKKIKKLMKAAEKMGYTIQKIA